MAGLYLNMARHGLGFPTRPNRHGKFFKTDFFFIVRFMMARMTNTTANKPASKPLVQQSLSEQKPLIIFSDNKRSCMDLRNQILLECPGLKGKIDVIHGELTPQHRAQLGSDFSTGKLLILICTTTTAVSV